MARKYTREKFLTKAQLIHNNKYDYSKSYFNSLSDKIIIICHTHGEFLQRASHHLSGQNCFKCCKENIRNTTDQFITKSKNIHGDKFNYDKTNYIKFNTKVDIVCNICNTEFKQSPRQHLSGKYNCPNCVKHCCALTHEEFLFKACKIHNNKYSYEEVIYINNISLIKIFCKSCNIYFLQSPSNHLRGQGCKKCASNSLAEQTRKCLDDFIKDAKIIHGDKYNYIYCNYINNYTKIDILCNLCDHIFEQIPSDHLSGRGCRACSSKRKGLNSRITETEFIERAHNIHGDKYEYNITQFPIFSYKVDIKCKSCNKWFKQMASSHLIIGNGCPYCAHSHISKVETEWLDYLQIPENKRQIVLNIQGKQFRVDAYNHETKQIFEFLGDFWHGNPKKYDPHKMNNVVGKTFGELYQKTITRENILKEAGYEVISIWESDWKVFKNN